MKGQVIWITGLSGAGKTTVARELKHRLKKLHLNPILLDGDILRHIFTNHDLNSNLYDRKTRINLALQYAALSNTLSLQGFTVITATISMFNEVYTWNRENLQNYFEIYLKVPLSELYLRDPKNIYHLYRSGKLNNVAGLDLLVDEPISPDVIYDFETQPHLWESRNALTESLVLELEKRFSLFRIRAKNNSRSRK